ncbi:unnamed protein product [Aphanomyces euteiches]
MAGLGFSNSEFSAMLHVPAENPEDEGKAEETTPEASPLPEESRPKPALPTVDVKKLGTWQKHTKGFGMKMLAKMGFKGRLGKDEQGVSAPVAVKARPNQLGLGFNDFKEAPTLKQNKEIERDLHGKTDDVDNEPTNELLRDDGAWRKRIVGGGKKRKRKTVEDVLQEEKTAIDLVVDMRGPLAQVYTDGLSSLKAQTIPEKPLLGQEILYNLRLIFNQTEGSIRDLNSRISVDRKRLNALLATHDTNSTKIRHDNQLVDNISVMLSSLQDLQTTLPEDPVAAIEAIVNTVVTLRTKFPAEFESHHVVDVMPSLGIPLFKALASPWQPLQVDDDAMQLRSSFLLVQHCLSTCVASLDANEASVFGTNIGSATRHNKIYDHMARQVLFPRIISSIHQWNVQAPCLDMIEFLDSFLSADLVQAILTEYILPRLEHHVRICQNVSDVERVHDWLLPWRGHFEVKFAQQVYPIMRETLARTIINWHPNDLSIFPVLLPWKDVWTPEDFAVFTHKHIVKKLIRVLNREFEINPKAQELEPLEWILAWHHVLPDRQFVALLEAEFFTKWLKVLAEWIRQNPSSAPREIFAWYLGWKSFFEEHELLVEERICMQFHGALQLMQFIQQASQLPGLKALPSTYEDALLRGKKRVAPVNPKHEVHDVNMRDVVEEYAQLHNIEFVPRHKNQDGQQIYGFGKQHIVIDHSLVFIETSKGKFEPIDVDELVKRA